MPVLGRSLTFSGKRRDADAADCFKIFQAYKILEF